MKHKRQLLGCLVALLLIPLGFAVGVLVARPPANSVDVLALAGAFGGAALTIIGAITVIEWERRMQSDRRRQIVKALVQDILKFSALARDPKVEDPANVAFGQATYVDELAAAIERAKGARLDFPPMNVGMVKAYSTLGMIDLNREAIAQDLTPAKFYGGPTDLGRHLEIVDLRAKQALAELDVEWLPVTGAD